MKIIIACLILITLVLIPPVFAQTAAGYRGQSMNGSTGLFGIPTGRIGWEAGNAALDIGYRAIINNDAGIAHIPAITASLFRWIEVSAAFDFRPDGHHKDNNDLLLGAKIKISNTSVAIGGNFQFINIGHKHYGYNAYQPYIAMTYPGTFFTMKAETTLVFGKTFYSDGRRNNSDIDFGMGFDVILFPDVFGDAVHWIIDFANFSYSADAWPYNPARYRGVLNTGFRFDFSTVPALSRYKFLIDVIFNDLFDDGHRSFAVGAVFGFRIS
jgi:hypothetical protein